MKSVLIFAAIRPGSNDAGERHVQEVSRGLKRGGSEVYLFTQSPVHNYQGKGLRELTQVFVPAFRTNRQWLNTVSFYLVLPLWSFSYFVRLRPNTVYTRFSFLDWVAIAPLKSLFQFTYIAEINGILSQESQRGSFRSRLIAMMEVWSLWLCDRVIGVTAELCEWATDRSKLKKSETATIGNAVDVEIFQPADTSDACAKLGLDAETTYIGFVGSMKHWHDLKTVIRALPSILAANPGTKLLMVGDGPEREALQEMVKGIGFEEVVQWTGIVPIEQVPLYINACEVCLAPFSKGRNQLTGVSPLKVFEYMSCGRPFVTSETGTSYDSNVRSWDSGIIVPAEEPEALAEAVITLLNDPAQRLCLGQNGREQVANHFSWQNVTDQIHAFISS